jgi:hypothetical protein
MKYLCPSLLFFLGFCLGCSPQSKWQLTSIPTGQKNFDSARLSYLTADSLAGLNLDFYYSNGSISSFLSTSGRQICDDRSAKALIQFQSETIEIPLDLHEGRMRIRLPDELSAKVIFALQNGEIVTISMGSTKQIFQPEEFGPLFQQFKKRKMNLLNSFQGNL